MEHEKNSKLTGVDIGVVTAYFVLVIAVGIFAMLRANRGTVSGFLLAGRSMWFLPIGASLFVSNIGTEHFMGLAGSGAAQGISVGAWELNALLLLQLLGWIFLPVYIASGICTMPEYLARRFGGDRLRAYFACLCLLIYVFIKCAADLFTGALFIQQALQWDLYTSMFLLIFLTALLTMTGGLTTVVYTDTLQALLMTCGSIYLAVKSFNAVGGFSGLLEKYPQAVPTNVSAIVPNTTCHFPDKNAFRMLRGIDDDYIPWLGFIIGQTYGSIWYWCADQVIVQRALAARSLSHAQGGTLLASFLKILPLFVMVMPGMVSRILYPNEVACTNPDYCMQVCQTKAGCSNIAYPLLVLRLMPEGARGLMMAVMMAALMSDLDSIFNSTSTLFTLDIWRRIRRKASNVELMVVGRVFIFVMVGVSMSWVQVIKENQKGQIFMYMQEVTNYVAPPLGVIYLLGVFFPFINEKGAFWSLMVALLVGTVRLFSSLILKGQEYCGSIDEHPEPSILKDFQYMYFSLFTTTLTAVLAVVISLLTGRPDEKLLFRTTYWTRLRKGAVQSEEWESTDLARPDENGDSDQTSLNLGPDEKDSYNINNTANGDSANLSVTTDAASQGPTIRNKLLSLICGIGFGPRDETKIRAMRNHLEKISKLEQTKWEKIILNTGCVIVVSIGIIMYIFWSVYDFDTAPFYPQGAINLLPGDSPKYSL